MNKFLFYLPRVIIGILTVGLCCSINYYLSLTILFSSIEGVDPIYIWYIAIGLIIEIIFLGLMFFTWKYQKIGGYIYIILSLLIIALAFASLYGGVNFVLILFAIIPLIAGILFVIEGDKSKNNDQRGDGY